jgi:hypothetical protein
MSYDNVSGSKCNRIISFSADVAVLERLDP